MQTSKILLLAAITLVITTSELLSITELSKRAALANSKNPNHLWCCMPDGTRKYTNYLTCIVWSSDAIFTHSMYYHAQQKQGGSQQMFLNSNETYLVRASYDMDQMRTLEQTWHYRNHSLVSNILTVPNGTTSFVRYTWQDARTCTCEQLAGPIYNLCSTGEWINKPTIAVQLPGRYYLFDVTAVMPADNITQTSMNWMVDNGDETCLMVSGTLQTYMVQNLTAFNTIAATMQTMNFFDTKLSVDKSALQVPAFCPTVCQ